jgi:hypothetical protein
VIEAPAARVALVALHHPGPLVRRHRARAGIRQQVDQDIVRRQQKEVVVCGPQQALALLAVVQRMGSTLLMRNGSMMVLEDILHC